MIMWRLLQLADSAFPTGAFAHSGGLEAAAQAREVNCAEDLRRFALGAIWQAGFGALPLLRAAHEETSALPALDARADAFLVNHVANRASRTQGRALLATCRRAFPDEVPELPAQHLAPLWGAVFRHLGVPMVDAQRIFLWSVARGMLSAAVRLGLAGTHQAQAMLSQLAGALEEALTLCGPLELEALAQTAPLADLLQATHDRLYSRLFQS